MNKEKGMLESLRANLISKNVLKIVSTLMFIQIFSILRFQVTLNERLKFLSFIKIEHGLAKI